MTAFEIIPALDLRGGQVVRLEQGDYARETVYDAEPGKVAERFVAAGATRLHAVDLEAARDGGAANQPALLEILSAAGSVPVQVGGGVRSLERIEELLNQGVDRVILGTVVLEDPELAAQAVERFPNRVILGLDARDGKIAIKGWRETAEVTPVQVLDRFVGLPLAAVLHTDIGRDGLLVGPNLEFTEKLAQSTPVPVIASGGVGSVEDLIALARTRVIAGAIVGKALYAGAVDLPDALEKVASC